MDVDEARSRQQCLTAAGAIWVVYDGAIALQGASRSEDIEINA
ncbi:hypothetical protein [Streptomyces sp. SD31]